MKKKVTKIVFTIILLILLDQGIKFYIQIANPNIDFSFVKINYVQNTGGAFGIASDNTITVIVSNLIVLGIIIKFMVSQFEKIDKVTKFMLCIVLAGGISNLLDRFCRGFVVDYIGIRKLSSV